MVEQTPIPFQTPSALGPYSQIGIDYGNSNGETFLGPVESGGGRYFVVFGRTDGSSTVTVRVTKSTDSGATWATQDIANEPVVDFAGGMDVCFSGTNLFITYARTLTAIRTITFSMATDTYGAPTADKTFTATVDLVNLRTVRVSNGDIFCFFDFNNNPGIQYAKLSGGVWGANQTIEAGGTADSFNLRSVVIDTTDLMHILYQTRIATGSTRQLSYRSLTTAGTLSARITIASQLNVNWNIGHASIWGDHLIVPAPPVVAGRLRGGVYVGAGLASISFAPFVQLDNATQSFAFNDSDMYSITSPDGITSYVFWSSQAGVGNNSELDAIYYASNDGSGWSDPNLFYDANAFPPADGLSADDQFIHRITINFLNSGLFGTAINMESNAFDSACVAYTLLDSAAVTQVWSITSGSLPDGLTLNSATGEVTGTPTVAGVFPFTVQVTNSSDVSDSPPNGTVGTAYSTSFPAVASEGDTATVETSITIDEAALSIICDNPPVGIVGTNYVHEFPVEGGTPPYTFDVIAGSLPPGLILDPDTGIISGTPTVNGIFPFTIRVTDSADEPATAEVECSITVRKRCLLVEVTA